ncbi:MAG: PadR family transcriptional regulator [Firmicutes bacterium]|nr:PadR family transcriptional regulator [Bacillota bacterium]
MMKLTNVEFMLLQIISENEKISGYEINQLVEERGYREWADIGTTSIYVGLNKLDKKKLVTSYIDSTKQGKGPLPRKFMITPEGNNILRQEIVRGLSSSRERDYRFDLALGATQFLPHHEVIIALHSRKSMLREAAKNINSKLNFQGGKQLPFNVRTLFEHPLFLIKNEIDFIDKLLDEFSKN